MGDYIRYVNELLIEYKGICVNEKFKNPEISIIVPVYNAEKYLERCLKSIIEQSFINIEIIIVNDGSSDMSKNIIDVFSSIDKRIIAIHQDNKGISVARNKGIELSRGKYILFVDSDDSIDNNFILNLYNAITKQNCDIAVANIVRKRKFTHKYRVLYKQEKIYTTLREKLKICKIPKCCYVWNKLYKSSLVKSHKFKENVYYEDILWLPEVLKQANKLITVPNATYYYWVNRNSIVKKAQNKQKQTDAYNAKKSLIDFYHNNNLVLPQKAENITKSIKYFLGIPILKIKEYKNTEITLLCGFLPIRIKNSCYQIILRIHK